MTLGISGIISSILTFLVTRALPPTKVALSRSSHSAFPSHASFLQFEIRRL